MIKNQKEFGLKEKMPIVIEERKDFAAARARTQICYLAQQNVIGYIKACTCD